MRVILAVCALMACTISMPALAASPEWDLESLSAPPRVWEATLEAEGVRGLFYAGLPHQGSETRVFAWLGMPEREEGETVPGVVLVHGGGGTAFAKWVRLWTDRGYAAIAMDLYGRTGTDSEGRKNLELPQHPWAGPDHYGRPGAMAENTEDDWAYHAVGNIILAHSLLRAQPGVDPERVGLTGISWGGFFSTIVPALDTRFVFSIPVYGASWAGKWPTESPNRWIGSATWMETWDAMHFIPDIRCPMLWVNGASDPHFPLRTHTPSYNRALTDKRLTIIKGFPHSHRHGWRPEEIYAFADSQVKNATPLTRILHAGQSGSLAGMYYVSARPVVRGDLFVTYDLSDDSRVTWDRIPAVLDRPNRLVTATLPAGVEAWFLNLTDSRGLRVSSPCHFAKGDEQ